MTLVEVVAAFALAALLLALLLRAERSHTRQNRLAADKLRAITAAEELVAGWSGPDAVPPLSGTGVIHSNPSLSWRVTETARPIADARDVRLVELTIYRDDTNEPLLTVELLTVADRPKRSLP